MRFLHPEILYALFALFIPIIVHLFQLRRFKSEQFTNVTLLKKLEITSRKSSQLKKWLTLLTRLLLLAFLIFAFAQPYVPTNTENKQDKQLSLFLDNSFSMSLNGEKGELFKQAKDDLLEYLPDNETFNLVTHSEIYKNLSKKELESIIFDLGFSPTALDLESVMIKTGNTFDRTANTLKNSVILSDFQTFNASADPQLNSEESIHYVTYRPLNTFNFSIDSLYLKNASGNNQLSFNVSASEPTEQSLPVSIYDGEILLGKFSLAFENEVEKEYAFTLETDRIENGRVEIEDSGLSYDNVLYFSIEKPDPVKVLVVSETYATYLDRIFDENAFEYNQVLLSNLEYSDIYSYDQVVLNQLTDIPESLILSLQNASDDSISIGIIPGIEANIISYNALFNSLKFKPYKTAKTQNIKLTTIHFDHPVFKNVFTDRVENFDYPTFESYFEVFSENNMLTFANGSSLLEVNGKSFRFNAPIENNSNFTKSPLVVLSFYNLAMQNQKTKEVYYSTGNENKITLNTVLSQDEVIVMEQNELSYIPRQQIAGDNVSLFLSDFQFNAGHYNLKTTKGDLLKTVAFNTDRTESRLNYLDTTTIENTSIYENFSDFTTYFDSTYNIKSIWKWFIALALMFMIIELFLLRLIK